jgi:hypothetical protein
MTETIDTAEEQAIGIIDETTPLGTEFDFSNDAPVVQAATLVQVDDAQIILDVGGDEVRVTRETWQSEYQPHVVGVTWPQPKDVDGDADEPETDNDDAGLYLSAEHVERLHSAQQHRAEAEEKWEAANDYAKALKKEMEFCQEQERKLIDEMFGTPGSLPLFEHSEPDQVEDATESTEGDDAWKSVRLDSLTDPAIPEGTLKILASAEITTLGELTAAQEANSQWWAKDIKGLGPATLDGISNATDAFWCRWSAEQKEKEQAEEVLSEVQD